MAFDDDIDSFTDDNDNAVCVEATHPDGLEVHKAIIGKDHDRLSDLIKAKASLEIKNIFGLTPIHVACCKADLRAVELLIK